MYRGKIKKGVKLFLDAFCRIKAETGITLNPPSTTAFFGVPGYADYAPSALPASIRKARGKLPITPNLIHAPEDRIPWA
jgi:hypothetical protein